MLFTISKCSKSESGVGNEINRFVPKSKKRNPISEAPLFTGLSVTRLYIKFHGIFISVIKTKGKKDDDDDLIISYYQGGDRGGFCGRTGVRRHAAARNVRRAGAALGDRRVERVRATAIALRPRHHQQDGHVSIHRDCVIQ